MDRFIGVGARDIEEVSCYFGASHSPREIGVRAEGFNIKEVAPKADSLTDYKPH